jgi:hypothetical protein
VAPIVQYVCKQPSKLKVRWKGPAQEIAARSAWIFEIQNLVTGLVKEAHASLFKFYADKDLEVSEELAAQVAHNDLGHVVEDFGPRRLHAEQKRYEVEVKWRGLRDLENS